MSTAQKEPNGKLQQQSRIQIAVQVASMILIPVVGYFWGQLTASDDRLSKTAEENRARILVIEGSLTDIVRQNTVSIDERRVLLKQVEENKAAIAIIRENYVADKAQRDSELVEQETQFASTENKLNAISAELHRMLSVVWNKSPELGPYPTGPFFFSNISQHNR